MARDIIGTLTCPHCGNPEATVHRQAKGKRSLYYRCYASRGGVEMRCGTVQIHGPAGQAWIEANMRPEGGQDDAAPPAPKATEADPAPAPTPKAPEATPPPRKHSSLLAGLVRHFNEEE